MIDILNGMCAYVAGKSEVTVKGRLNSANVLTDEFPFKL